INEQAPDFTLPSTSGKELTLSKDLLNKPCIIYFYPKDFTSVCTKEACAFRDEFAAFREVDIAVYGISRDDIPTHQKFKEQHQLPFDLLSDKSGKVCKAYSALVPIIGLPKRITYLLNKDHRIAGVFQDMFSAEKHIKQMIEKVQTKSYL
ncbi:MAG: peroxiredoxin, partial [Bacteroidota bacterium]